MLTPDESFSWRLTGYSFQELTLRTGADVHPPLYYLLLKAWVALCGSSPFALRGLSVVLSVLCVPIIYVVCLEACRGPVASRKVSATAAWSAALFSACLLAVHASQVTHGRTARMYSLGILLAGLTSWLLLRALRAQQLWGLWWSAYGLAVAAFCYTHYYAFFTVLAQTVFVAGDLIVRARRDGLRAALAPAAGFVFAGVVALTLYSPWLSELWRQTREVHQTYWIPAVTWRATQRALFAWGTGMDYQVAWELWLWLLLLVGSALWALARADRAAWFFLLQALVPWLASVGVSLASGRPILFERYLVFAQFSLLAFWSVVWCCLPGIAGRLFLACFLGTTTLSGLWDAALQWPQDRPALAKAADFLQSHHQAGDLIEVDRGAPAVNQLRYYLTQAGAGPVEVRCHASLFAGAVRFTHSAALTAGDFFWEGHRAEGGIRRRLWRGFELGGFERIPPQGMRLVLERTFEGGGGTRYTLALYEPKE
jgi:hypothetical protein